MRRIVATVLISLVVFTPLGIAIAEGETTPVLSDVGAYSIDARAARISALKEQFKISLSDKEKTLVSSRCVGAQGELRKISTRLLVTSKEREVSYSSAILNLIQLKSALEAKHTDTSNIDLLIVLYQQKKTSFDTAILAYELSLEDVVSIDCVHNPDDFRAALEGVRSARKPVVDASSQIREITRSNLKTTFDSILIRLQTEDSGHGE